jgi:hypothetical protein
MKNSVISVIYTFIVLMSITLMNHVTFWPNTYSL